MPVFKTKVGVVIERIVVFIETYRIITAILLTLAVMMLLYGFMTGVPLDRLKWLGGFIAVCLVPVFLKRRGHSPLGEEDKKNVSEHSPRA